MSSSPIVLELVLLLTIAVLVAFTPSADALHCSIGGGADFEFDEDLLKIMESELLKRGPSAGDDPFAGDDPSAGDDPFAGDDPSAGDDPFAGMFGKLERLKLIFKAVGVTKCPAGTKQCMSGKCTLALDSLGESLDPLSKEAKVIPYLKLLGKRFEISFGACGPKDVCKAGKNHEVMGPIKCEYSCCTGNMCNGAIGLLHNCGTFATILGTFYAFLFLRYM